MPVFGAAFPGAGEVRGMIWPNEEEKAEGDGRIGVEGTFGWPLRGGVAVGGRDWISFLPALPLCAAGELAGRVHAGPVGMVFLRAAGALLDYVGRYQPRMAGAGL